MSKLKITQFYDPGKQASEAVFFHADEGVDLGYFMISDSTYDKSGPTNKWQHTYRFPHHWVDKGDIVILYTRSGEPSVADSSSGALKYKVHKFYMNLKVSVWNNSGDEARLYYQVQKQEVKKS